MEKQTSSQVCKNFVERFGENVEIKYSGCSDTREDGSIVGEYNDVPFFITFNKDRVAIFISYRDREMANIMLPFLSDLFGGKSPSFEYGCDFKSFLYNPEESFVLEWTNDKEKRKLQLKKLADPEEYAIESFPGVKIYNLSDYTETEKVYGIYPGDLENPVEVSDMPYEDESLLFCAIYNILVDIAYNSYSMDEVKLEQRCFALDYAIYKTKSLGLDVSEPEPGKRISHGEKFYAWFEGFCSIYRMNNILCEQVTKKPNSGRVKTDLPKAPVSTV